MRLGQCQFIEISTLVIVCASFVEWVLHFVTSYQFAFRYRFKAISSLVKEPAIDFR